MTTGKQSYFIPFIILFLFVTFQYGPFLVSESVLGESAMRINLIENGDYQTILAMSGKAGRWMGSYLVFLMAKLPGLVFPFKLFAFINLLVYSFAIYGLLRRLEIGTVRQALLIALITIALPCYSSWQEAGSFGYGFTHACFYAGLFFYFTRSPWIKAAGMILLFLSFSLHIFLFLIYLYLVMIMIVKYDHDRSFKKNVLSFIREHALLIILPLATFVFYRTFFTLGSIWQELGYNQFSFSVWNILSAMKKSLINQLLFPISNLKDLMVETPYHFIGLLIVGFPVIGVIHLLLINRLDGDNVIPDRRPFILMMIAGVLLLFGYYFPVAMVLKYVANPQSRFLSGAGFPSAIILVGGIEYLRSKKKLMSNLVFGLILSISFALNIKYQADMMASHIKHEAITVNMKSLSEPKESLILLDDKTKWGIDWGYHDAVVNRIYKQAWGNERHYGVFYQNYPDRSQMRKNIPNRLARLQKDPFLQNLIMVKDLDHNRIHEELTFTISKNVDLNSFQLCMNYYGRSSVERRQWLDSLITLAQK